MLRLLAGGFLAAHGVVHVWYVVLSRGWVEVEGAGWNGYSWLLSSVASRRTVLAAASVLYTVVGVGFVAGGVGYALSLGWATPALVGAAVLSAALIVALWDGQREALVDKGALGVVIDLGIVAALLVL